MQKKSIVFLGSKPIGYECFRHLIAMQEKCNYEIAGLLTQQRREFGSGHDLAALAAEHSIPLIADLALLPACDILYSVQYHQILKQEHIDKAKMLALNLHMAPLPEYRGSNQFSFAILDGKKEFGTTIHQMDARIDHGDIFFYKRFPIPEGCWVNDLYQLTYEASLELFKETLEQLVAGNCQPTPQQELVARYGTSLHYRSEMATIKIIDLDWDSQKIERHIRATSMPGFEPPYTLINGTKIFFTTRYQ